MVALGSPELEFHSADAVTEAYEKDLEIQERYGVDYQRCWFDEDSGKVFCLVEAPDEESATAGRREARACCPTRSSQSRKAAEVITRGPDDHLPTSR